jgi:hypothetical protein
MRIEFQTPSSAIDDKSTEGVPAKDTDIHNVYLFLVNKGTGKVYSVFKGENIQEGSNESTKTVEVVLKFGASAPAEASYFCYVVTNITLAEEDMDSYKNLDYTTLFNVLKIENYTKTPLTQGLTMWGMTPENKSFTKDKAPKELDIKLLRSLARVDVGLGSDPSRWDGTNGGIPIPFVFKSVHILRANQGYSYMPNEDERNIISEGLNGDAANYKPAVSMPSSVGAKAPVTVPLEAIEAARHFYENTNTSNTPLASSVKSVQNIYIPESEVKLGGTSFDTNHKERCAIIVGGYYNDDAVMSYYRIDFNPLGSLVDVLRNTQYVLSITSVEGSGYPTPEEAYLSQSMNMTVEILGWDSSHEEIVFDGANWFSIESKEVIFKGHTSPMTLNAASSIPAAEWEMMWESEIAGGYTTASELTAQYFRVTKPTSGDSGDLIITPLEKFNEPAKFDKLYIKVDKRLNITIEVSQVREGNDILTVDGQIGTIIDDQLIPFEGGASKAHIVSTDNDFIGWTAEDMAGSTGFMTYVLGGGNGGMVKSIFPENTTNVLRTGTLKIRRDEGVAPSVDIQFKQEGAPNTDLPSSDVLMKGSKRVYPMIHGGSHPERYEWTAILTNFEREKVTESPLLADEEVLVLASRSEDGLVDSGYALTASGNAGESLVVSAPSRDDENKDKYTAELKITYKRKSEYLPQMIMISAPTTMVSTGSFQLLDYYPSGATAQNAKGLVLSTNPLIVASAKLLGPIPINVEDPSIAPYNLSCNEDGFDGMTGAWFYFYLMNGPNHDGLLNTQYEEGEALARNFNEKDKQMLYFGQYTYEIYTPAAMGAPGSYYKVEGGRSSLMPYCAAPLMIDDPTSEAKYNFIGWHAKLTETYRRCVYTKN